MKVVVAPDSFKGSIPALRAAEIMREAVLAVHPAARVISVPLADGGEGSLDIVHRLLGGQLRSTRAPGPDGTQLTVPWLLLEGGKRVFVESAAVLGLTLLDAGTRNTTGQKNAGKRSSRLNALHLSSEGLGVLLRDIYRSKAGEIIVALGGSAVNDCGSGMARALGMEHRPQFSGKDLPGWLASVTDIIPPLPAPAARAMTVLLDVDNPLTGPEGATAVYGPQKGVPPSRIRTLDRAIAHYAGIVRRDIRDIDDSAPGCGAAGGLGFALQAFCAATPVMGTTWFIEQASLEEELDGADLMLTGEGQCDEQTAYGKVVAGAAAAAQRCGVPSIAVAGRVRGDAEMLRRQLRLSTLRACAPGHMEDGEAMRRAEELLFKTVCATLRGDG